MIIKIKSRKNNSYRQLIEYMLHDKDRISPRQEGFVIAHNLRGNRIDGWVSQLKDNDAHRKVKRKDSVTCYHEILSWHADDSRHITPEKMESMTREYIKLRGASGAKILAVPHYNKTHNHVHLLVSGVDWSGKAMRLGREELAEVKKKVQQYQMEKFPEMVHSVVGHGMKGKQRTPEKETQTIITRKKMSTREKVAEMVHAYYAESLSEEDFYAKLEGAGLQKYYRGGKEYGVQFEGRKYRFKTLKIKVGFEFMSDQSKERSRELHLSQKSRRNERRR